MFLFEGYFGRILHTGDMRFNEQCIYKNPILFPQELRNEQFNKISLQIDECIFDNTFCDPIFKFPKRDEAFQEIIKIIEIHKNIPNLRVLICIDSLGKEEILITLAQKYNTLIIVDEMKYKMIQNANIRPQYFTKNPSEGWIEAIRKHQKEQRMKQNDYYYISITCTGWINTKEYHTSDDRNYDVAYSLHSNFEELELFVKSIQPSILKTVVKNNNKGEKIYRIHQFSSYKGTLVHLNQRGVDFFQNNYVDYSSLSNEYKSLLQNEEKKQEILGKLNLIDSYTDEQLIDLKENLNFINFQSKQVDEQELEEYEDTME